MTLVSKQTIVHWMDEAQISLRKATKAADEYNQKKPGIEQHIRKHPRIYGAEDFSIRNALEANYTLTDLTRVVNFHTARATMLHTAVLAQKAYRDLLEVDFS